MKTEVSGFGKKQVYRAILFDLGGVLSLGKKSEDMGGVHEEVAKKLGFSMDHYLDAIDGTYPDAIAGKISGEEAMRKLSKNLNTSPEKLAKLYTKKYKKNFMRNMPLYKFALKLKKAGYKIGIISDIWPVAKDVFFSRDYYKNFDLVIASCDIGSRKTHKKIFQVALRHLGVKPKEAIFIDNEKWNMPAPRSLGIKAIQFKGNSLLVKDLEKLGVRL